MLLGQRLTGARLPWERCRGQEGTAAQSPACPHGGGVPSSTQWCHQPQHRTLQPLGSHQSSAARMWTARARHNWVPSALSLPTFPFLGWRHWDGSVLGARHLLAPRAQPRDSLTPAVPVGSGDKVLAQPPTLLSPSGAISHPNAPQSQRCCWKPPHKGQKPEQLLPGARPRKWKNPAPSPFCSSAPVSDRRDTEAVCCGA